MEIPDIRFWAGTEESFAAFISALKTASTLDIQAYHDAKASADGEETPRLLTQQGNVGVIAINGPLVPGAPWHAPYSGVTGYGEIRAALVAAANNPDIGGILLDVNSGGGAVSGVTDVAELIAMIDAKVKPVQTFSDGMIASAAYWLGSSARSVEVGKVTEAGSIGVITVHKEMSRLLEKMGITTTVLRAGEFKALGNPMEPLTDTAKAEIQGQLDQMYQMFLGHVADARGVTPAVADSKFAQGRVFIGDRAVHAGLVDGVSNFDAVISTMQGAIDAEKTRSQYGANFPKGPGVKNALTEQQLAALSESGGAAAAAAASQSTPVDPPKNVVTEPAKPAAAEPSADHSKNELVAYLQGQLSAAQASVTTLTGEVTALKAAAEAAAGVRASMRTLVEASMSRLKVALGHSAGAYASVGDDALLAEHANVRAEFETKFKAGGVAAVTPSGSSEKTAEAPDPVRAARIQATRPRK